jgi:hypothetical protein
MLREHYPLDKLFEETDSATSPIMKRAKHSKQEASRKMGWMSF